VFGFAARRAAAGGGTPPAVERFRARDGEALAYRLYDSQARRILIFAHGSSYHGGGYHGLAAALSGAAVVALPNLRGHFLSGRRRGDVDYVGQLEDDLADLIAALRARGHDGPVTIGGHSSGGGLAIRFAGGPHGALADSALLLAPVIPTSATLAGGGSAGGWASFHRRRAIGLTLLGGLGIHGFDALPVIEFNKPEPLWDGTETLAYSHRLNASYHPRPRYAPDLEALPERTLVLVGAEDETLDEPALAALFDAHAPAARVAILPSVDHFGVFQDPAALEAARRWLEDLPR
jgi:alpha-beta hydrolase superfamily lysophospholipase